MTIEPKDHAFDKLEEIALAEDTHLIEMYYDDDLEIVQLDLWKQTYDPSSKSQKVSNKYLNFDGSLMYHPETNKLWITNPDRLSPVMILAVKSYFEEIFEKEPHSYYLDEQFVVREYDVFKELQKKDGVFEA